MRRVRAVMSTEKGGNGEMTRECKKRAPTFVCDFSVNLQVILGGFLGCAGSSLPHGLSLVVQSGSYLRCSSWAPCCGSQNLEHAGFRSMQASGAAAPGL